MTTWMAVLLGLIQGATEFLPVSSTAHLRIVPTLLGQPDAGAAFTAVIQLGTLAAVIVYFARDVGRMTVGVFRGPKDPDGKLALMVILGTIPIGLAGLALKRFVEGDLRSLWVVASTLAVVGIIMAVVERRHTGKKLLGELGWSGALMIGCAQACAIVPGVSRSGATLTAALLIGLARPEAARFSFLLSIPAVAAAGVFELKKSMHDLHGQLQPILIATVVAFFVGYAAIAWLMRYLATRTLTPFAIYRVLLAGALVTLLASGVIPAL